MGFNRFFGASVLSLAILAGCGGGGSSNTSNTNTGGTGSTGGTGTISMPVYTAGVYKPEADYKNFCAKPRSGIDPYTRQAYPDKAGSAEHEKMWLRSWTNNTYLWYREVVDRDPAPYSVAQYFNLLKTEQLTDSGTPKDNFHFTENTAEYQQQIQQFLAHHPDATAVALGIDITASQWQLLPGEQAADGFFYAKLQKKANG